MRLLPAPGATASRGRWILAAWLLALLPALAFFAVRVATGQAALAVPLGPGFAAFAAYSILLAPLLETTAMLPFAALLRRLPAATDLPRILLLATLAAAVHAIEGGAWAAAGAWWPFAVYSACLLAWWPRSMRDAFVVTAAVHALYNAGILAVGVAAARAASAAAIPP